MCSANNLIDTLPSEWVQLWGDNVNPENGSLDIAASTLGITVVLSGNPVASTLRQP